MNRRCSVCGDVFVPQKPHHRWCWRCWRRENDAAHEPRRPRTAVVEASGLDEALIRDCIRLTHPDAHPPERFQFANDVTARLLELLERTRRKRAA